MKRVATLWLLLCGVTTFGCTSGSTATQGSASEEGGAVADARGLVDAAGLDLRPARDGGDVVTWRAFWPVDPKTFSTTEPLLLDLRCISGGRTVGASAYFYRVPENLDDTSGPRVHQNDDPGTPGRIDFDTTRLTPPGRYRLSLDCYDRSEGSDTSYGFPFVELVAGSAPARVSDGELARLLRTPTSQGGGAASFTAFGIDRTTLAPGSNINGRGACVNRKGVDRTARIAVVRNDGTGTEITATTANIDRPDGAFRFQLTLPADTQQILHTLYLFCGADTYPPTAARLLTIGLPPTR